MSELVTLNSILQWREAYKELEWRLPHPVECCVQAGRSFDPIHFAFSSAFQVSTWHPQLNSCEEFLTGVTLVCYQDSHPARG